MQENEDTIVISDTFIKDKHINYLTMMFESDSEKLASFECHKIFNLYFVLTGLEILDGLDQIDTDKQNIIDFIYNQQFIASKENSNAFGFLGGPFLGFTKHQDSEQIQNLDENIHYSGNLVYTFPALCTLIMLEDDLSKVNKQNIIKGMKKLQLENGCFQSTFTSREYDLRFLYAACAISYILNDWSGIDVEKATLFIQRCQSYDYAYGFTPNQEAHAASTFLAVASLKLMGKDDIINNSKTQIITWCINRQYGGFQGRINKLIDSCYSFWVGGTLQILDYEQLINKEELSAFLMFCQSPYGGLSKFPEMDFADPVHTLHSLFGFGLINKFDLKKPKTLLNITENTYQKWIKLSNSKNSQEA